MEHEDYKQEHAELIQGQHHLEGMVGKIQVDVGEVKKDLEYHLATTHGEMISEDINGKLLQVCDQLDFMADVVLGEPEYNPIDGQTTRTGGMKALVAAHQNGGIRAKVPKWLVSILVAIIIAVSTIGGAVIQKSNIEARQIQEVVEHVLEMRAGA